MPVQSYLINSNAEPFHVTSPNPRGCRGKTPDGVPEWRGSKLGHAEIVTDVFDRRVPSCASEPVAFGLIDAVQLQRSRLPMGSTTAGATMLATPACPIPTDILDLLLEPPDPKKGRYYPNFSSGQSCQAAVVEEFPVVGIEETQREHVMLQSTRKTTPPKDGYNWKKYGQKQVNGGEYPRSYYKCTHPDCPAKKKVEHAYDGEITKIIYEAMHNHTKPEASHQDVISTAKHGISVTLEEAAFRTKILADCPALRFHKIAGASQVNRDSEQLQYSSTISKLAGTLSPGLYKVDNHQDKTAQEKLFATEKGRVDLESELKRSKTTRYLVDADSSSRNIHEPRIVIQMESEADILQDGYRWRKYGQKVVKGNPNPRSYYKCTSPGCPVRKHVERASDDLKSVITSYEGKHNHEVPDAKSNIQRHNNSMGGDIFSPITKGDGSVSVIKPEKHDVDFISHQLGQNAGFVEDCKYQILNSDAESTTSCSNINCLPLPLNFSSGWEVMPKLVDSSQGHLVDVPYNFHIPPPVWSAEPPVVGMSDVISHQLGLNAGFLEDCKYQILNPDAESTTSCSNTNCLPLPRNCSSGWELMPKLVDSSQGHLVDVPYNHPLPPPIWSAGPPGDGISDVNLSGKAVRLSAAQIAQWINTGQAP